MSANVAGSVPGTGRKTAGHPWFHRLTRTGLAARGIIYLLIGLLAAQIGMGNGKGEADQKGALATVVGTPGGTVALWLIVVGFAGLALWQYAEARYGQPVPDGHKAHNRLVSFTRGLLYTASLIGALAFALGHQGGSTDQRSQAFTAKVMAEPGGRWVVLAIAAGFLIVGAAIIYTGARREFLQELKTGQIHARARQAVTVLGLLGNCARGLVFSGVGVFLGYAAITFDPGKAKGLDGTLRESAHTPAGPWLLVAVAVGLAIFGVYSFCEARWRKVETVRA
ncbi:DUF1206 domain-containing protein [Actinomadura soli]|uniref:DUF1206 domain-containing protein n=1 Tax=Actinomadura soli TaxID=2508997 RepID=A0A5C4JFX4_9ACTN|nr:DUF1206 domain-containing protein [Actinomadura soli]TMR04742.1 DUF1206 domain-containing protein [Actinomadura soli]